MLMTLGTMVRQPLDPSKVGHWSHGSDGYFPSIIYDYIMRQIYDNISLYLSLVWWYISDGKDPRHHGESTIGPPKVGRWSHGSGGCFLTIISNYILKLKYDNISLYLTLVWWYISHGYDPGHHGDPTWRLPIGRLEFWGGQGLITTHNFEYNIGEKPYDVL